MHISKQQLTLLSAFEGTHDKLFDNPTDPWFEKTWIHQQCFTTLTTISDDRSTQLWKAPKFLQL